MTESSAGSEKRLGQINQQNKENEFLRTQVQNLEQRLAETEEKLMKISEMGITDVTQSANSGPNEHAELVKVEQKDAEIQTKQVEESRPA